jgi:AcrR family transcriptional regulator
MSLAARKPEDASTRERLVAAAAAAFNGAGFHGTDTNRIARAAGFAPQTFYRHFEDKSAIFLAVYQAWEASQAAAVRDAAKGRDPARSVAEAVIAHHRAWVGFRRSLRLLAIEDARVRAARTEGRLRQLAALRAASVSARPESGLIADLLCIERLADAIAEGEWRDLGVSEEEARGELVAAVRRARA